MHMLMGAQVYPMIEGLSFFLGKRTIKLSKLIAKKACKAKEKKKLPRTENDVEPAAELDSEPAWASDSAGVQGGGELNLDDAVNEQKGGELNLDDAVNEDVATKTLGSTI